MKGKALLYHLLMRYNKKLWQQASISRYKVAKRMYLLIVSIKRLAIDSFLVTAGILSAGFGLKGFLLPNQFVDGGATGIALLTSEVSGIPLAVLLILVNIPFIIMALRVIGVVFSIKTLLAIAGLALCTAFIKYPQITNDKLLVAVFGGFFLGLGIGLAMRGGAVIDGTEVLALFLTRRTGLTIGDIILCFNIIIFSIASYLLGVEVALYSILTYLAASKSVDFVIEGIEEYTGVTIITIKPEEVRLAITETLGHGVTIYQGKRGYGKRGEKTENIDIIYTVITRLEVSKLNAEIEKIDPNAFIIMNSIKDTRGGMIKKRALKH
ncbi:MAG: YitT family protein [Cytophagaceae bacterium]|nr:YitT family protein [Cytophagaceae bacterium]MDW8456631.1 YitT family protein [Cytophagaceae bacterium]